MESNTVEKLKLKVEFNFSKSKTLTTSDLKLKMGVKVSEKMLKNKNYSNSTSGIKDLFEGNFLGLLINSIKKKSKPLSKLKNKNNDSLMSISSLEKEKPNNISLDNENEYSVLETRRLLSIENDYEQIINFDEFKNKVDEMEIKIEDLEKVNETKNDDNEDFKFNKKQSIHSNYNYDTSSINSNTKFSNLEKSPACKSWNILINIGQAINKLNKINVKKIDNVEELDTEFKCFKEKKRKSENGELDVSNNLSNLHNDYFSQSIKSLKSSNHKSFFNSGKKEKLISINKKLKDAIKKTRKATDEKLLTIEESFKPTITKSFNNNENSIRVVINKSKEKFSNNNNNINIDLNKSNLFKDKFNLNDHFYNEKSENTNDAIQKIFSIQRIYEFITNGNEDNMNQVEEYFLSDPKRQIFQDPKYYEINKKSICDFFPLHLAVLNGHIIYVKLLIKLGADCFIKINDETMLDVCVRWNHFKLLDYFFKSFKWPFEYLKKAKSYSHKFNASVSIKKRILEEIKKQSLGFCLCS